MFSPICASCDEPASPGQEEGEARARHATLAETGQSGGEGQISATQRSTENTMRDVLLDLADDMSRGIIVEWLEPADVARLDSAYNNRALSRVLRSLLCSPLTLFDVSYSTSCAKLKWAMKRRLHLGSIRIDSSIDSPTGRCVEFHRTHVLPGQTQGAEHR